MPGTILLSSSPPRPWARSPTVVDIPSSPTTSQDFSLRSRSSARRFRITHANRDGFSDSPGAKSALKIRTGAENLPIRSPRKLRLPLSTSTCVESTDNLKSGVLDIIEDSVNTEPVKVSTNHKIGRSERRVLSFEKTPHTEPDHDPIEHDDLESVEFSSAQRPRSNVTPPAGTEQKVYRRLDWTPVKDQQVAENQCPALTGMSTAFPQSFVKEFAYQPAERAFEAENICQNVAKRRRLNPDEPSFQVAASTANAAVVDASEICLPATKRKSKGKSKSPTKKALTITSLATAHYLGEDLNKNSTPMMDFLSSTQARVQDANDDGVIKRAKLDKLKKAGATKRVTRPKSTLLSPISAMQKLNDQELIFGSASQLVHGEHAASAVQAKSHQLLTSPLKSDSIPTQESLVVSGPNTPGAKKGLARYSHRKNLWSAAGRDEDNALLHLDAVDLAEESAVRFAFAGKDVLLQPDRAAVNLPSHGNPMDYESSDMKTISGTKGPQAVIYNIEDLNSPATVPASGFGSHVQQRQLHTASRSSGIGRTVKPTAERPLNDTLPKPRVPHPRRPSFSGFTLHELRKQIAAYGFKPVKGRENMVSLLERCWDEKHKDQDGEAREEADHESTTHGDFLSKVHDISSRPVPKMKRSRSKSKEKTTSGSVKTTPKAKRQPKATTRTDKEPAGKKKVKAVVSQPREATLDDTVVLKEKSTPSKRVTQKPEADSAVYYDAIRRAIMQQSLQPCKPGYNHQTSPTWHEKILMYDPIVLEDLTVWLNTHGFAAITEDSEVSAHDVRAWCEMEGICCLWRGGWRGQKDKNAED